MSFTQVQRAAWSLAALELPFRDTSAAKCARNVYRLLKTHILGIPLSTRGNPSRRLTK